MNENKIPNVKLNTPILKPAKSSLPIFSEERTELPEIGALDIPSDNIQCATCRYRLKGAYGYRNGNCGKYLKKKGKPNGVLFNGDKCIYYRKDRGN